MEIQGGLYSYNGEFSFTAKKEDLDTCDVVLTKEHYSDEIGDLIHLLERRKGHYFRVSVVHNNVYDESRVRYRFANKSEVNEILKVIEEARNA